MPIDSHRLEKAPRVESYEVALARLERETVRHVAEQMRGCDATSIHAALVSELEGRFPGVDFDHRHLQQIASALAEGALRI
jgi:hypothetical protein